MLLPELDPPELEPESLGVLGVEGVLGVLGVEVSEPDGSLGVVGVVVSVSIDTFPPSLLCGRYPT